MTDEHVDVLIVGAGLSGIGAAVHILRSCPGKSVAILEARTAIGGTWDLFRYPGVRSDSDMFTLGYPFRPWTGTRVIADGKEILSYLRDTAREEGVESLVRLRTRVVGAAWSSSTARWTATAVRTDAAGVEEPVELTCSFLFVCSGYYRYDQGYRPTLAGEEEFGGRVVHPQHWPVDLDVTGQRVVVLGSGATAVSLVPALAETAGSVTMLQRSPSYIGAVGSRDRLAEGIRRRLPPWLAYRLVRGTYIARQVGIYQLSLRRPAALKWLLRRDAIARLPYGYAVDTHFAPAYNPWDQRLCAAADGDLFRVISEGRADVVTDRVERLDRTGVVLASGGRLAADVLVTATGLELLVIGGMSLMVDGRPVETAGALTYKGLMFAGVPNFAFTLGYTNASWALRSDLVARYVCRLLKHLDRTGAVSATPVAPPADRQGPLAPIIDLPSGYVRRSVNQLPRQGGTSPWRLQQNYLKEVALLRGGPVTDSMLIRTAAPCPTRLPAEPSPRR